MLFTAILTTVLAFSSTADAGARRGGGYVSFSGQELRDEDATVTQAGVTMPDTVTEVGLNGAVYPGYWEMGMGSASGSPGRSGRGSGRSCSAARLRPAWRWSTPLALYS